LDFVPRRSHGTSAYFYALADSFSVGHGKLPQFFCGRIDGAGENLYYPNILFSVSLCLCGEIMILSYSKLQNHLARKKDLAWLYAWVGGLGLLWLWDLLFLNAPARKIIVRGFTQTLLICGLVIVFTLGLGWAAALLLDRLRSRKRHALYLLVTFGLNLVRSVPQIVGVLFGYILVTQLMFRGVVQNSLVIAVLMAFTLSLFMFNELADLIGERIAYYRQLDFYDAMRVCGIAEWRIINMDILLKNSRLHIINKLIAVFGMAVFLQCSVDFIISVGLSNQVSAVDLPATLGSLLAKIDSKQDILAIGYTLTHPWYVWNLFFKHLQGISVALVLVFTLICMHQISDGYAERHRL
jgi:ABC-type dipeptide/oligopeptide/nickel transport system permease subunit